MVKITFPDGSVREYEQGVTGLQIAESISPALARNVVSCGVNGETVELDRPINEDASVELYKFEDEQGKHTFWHTSAHLLAEALQELYPGIQFGFGPAVESGFFYDVMPAEGQVISENDFAKIEAKMMELAKKNEPVVRKEIAKADALAEFKADGQTYKCEHIEQDLEDGTITTYTQGNFTDLCRGPHLLNTGLIKAVKITSVAGAFWRGDAKREQMTRIYGISFPKKHDASQIRRFQHVAHDVVLDAREETEHDHVRVESQMGYHRLVVIRSEDVVLVILEIDAHIAEVRMVERFEGVESLGIYLDGAVASDQLAVEEDAYLRHHRSAVLVLCRCYLDGGHQILLAVGTQFADRQLATGQDHRLGQVLKHEAQGR